MKALTPKQERVLRFVLQRMHDSGRRPTIQEVSHGLGFSYHNAVTGHFAALVRKGYMKHEGHGRYVVLRNVAGESIEGWHRVPILLAGAGR